MADRESLAKENLRRHICGAGDLDRKKTEAVANLLRQRFDDLKVQSQTFCFLREPARLRQVIARSEIVLVAVDAEGPKHLIDAMCWEHGRPAVYTGVYGGGWGAEVILVDPTLGTACYACSARVPGRIGIELTVPEPNPFYTLPGDIADSANWLQADLASIMPTAALAAALVKASLAARRGNDQVLRELRLPGARSSWPDSDPDVTELLDDDDSRPRMLAGPSSAWRLALRQIESWHVPPWTPRSLPPWEDVWKPERRPVFQPSTPRPGLPRSSDVSGKNIAPRRQAPWRRIASVPRTGLVSKHASIGASPVVSIKRATSRRASEGRIKVAAVRSERCFTYIERHGARLVESRFQVPGAVRAIDLSAQLYLKMKAEPPFPGNEPASLRSYGHRFSRALESRSHYLLTHGEAVATEMAVAARLAALRGVLDRSHADRVVSLLTDLDLLPYCPECDADSIWDQLTTRPAEPGGILLPVPGPVIGAGTFLAEFSKEDLTAAIASVARLHDRRPISGKVEYRTTRAGEQVLVTAIFRESGEERYCESDCLEPLGRVVRDLTLQERTFAYRLLRRGIQYDTLPRFRREGEVG